MGLLVILVLGPLNFLCGRGRRISGCSRTAHRPARDGKRARSNVVDAAWAAMEWTLARAMRTSRFWWMVLGFFCALFAWYAVQVHQTKYLVEVGFTPLVAAWALGIVSVVAIPGQIRLALCRTGLVGNGFGRRLPASQSAMSPDRPGH